MVLLVRTWNLFHGNTEPPGRAGLLRRMVELATADDPDILCLQEVPVWALRRLGPWSGMTAVGVVTRPAARPGVVSTWITGLNQGLFRSALAGQANAVLVASRHQSVDLGHERISALGRERRLVQAARLSMHASRHDLVVANLHASNEFGDADVPRAEAARARDFAERHARPGEPVVIAGDFNVAEPRFAGYSAPTTGIDHILVRGGRVRELTVWPRERRMQDGLVLSDHAPVDCVMELP